MEIVGGYEKGKKNEKKRKMEGISVHNYKDERGNNGKWILGGEGFNRVSC